MKILALESPWNHKKYYPRLSVQPFIEAICEDTGSKYAYYTFLSESGFKELFPLFLEGKFDLLYLACHGGPGVFYLGNRIVPIETIAAIIQESGGMGGKYLHMGSCSVLNIEEERIREIARNINAKRVSGYMRDVGWGESIGTDTYLLSALQDGGIRRFKKILQKYKPVFDDVGFRFIER